MKKYLFLAAVNLSNQPGKECFAKIWQDFGYLTTGLGAKTIEEVQQKLKIGMTNKNLFYYGTNTEKIMVKPSDSIIIYILM